jgi:hypothetical protein
LLAYSSKIGRQEAEAIKPAKARQDIVDMTALEDDMQALFAFPA